MARERDELVNLVHRLYFHTVLRCYACRRPALVRVGGAPCCTVHTPISSERPVDVPQADAIRTVARILEIDQEGEPDAA